MTLQRNSSSRYDNLQQYLSIAALNLKENSKFWKIMDEIGDFGQTQTDILDNLFILYNNEL